MKEVIAIIRRDKTQQTKAGLLGIGVPALTMISVEGRGRQAGLMETSTPESVEITMDTGFIPKRMLTMVVDEADVNTVIDTIMRINRTGHIGDGKVFVCPVGDAVRIRTGENGEDAI